MTKYYVDFNGTINSTDTPPEGHHIEFLQQQCYEEVYVVSDQDGKVIEEAVLWDSLEELTKAIEGN